jgi:hypothetical protein
MVGNDLGALGGTAIIDVLNFAAAQSGYRFVLRLTYKKEEGKEEKEGRKEGQGGGLEKKKIWKEGYNGRKGRKERRISSSGGHFSYTLFFFFSFDNIDMTSECDACLYSLCFRLRRFHHGMVASSSAPPKHWRGNLPQSNESRIFHASSSDQGTPWRLQFDTMRSQFQYGDSGSNISVVQSYFGPFDLQLHNTNIPDPMVVHIYRELFRHSLLRPTQQHSTLCPDMVISPEFSKIVPSQIRELFRHSSLCPTQQRSTPCPDMVIPPPRPREAEFPYIIPSQILHKDPSVFQTAHSFSTDPVQQSPGVLRTTDVDQQLTTQHIFGLDDEADKSVQSTELKTCMAMLQNIRVRASRNDEHEPSHLKYISKGRY